MNERQQCPDGGTCHHECERGGPRIEDALVGGDGSRPAGVCWRVLNAEPLSGVFPNDQWPEGAELAGRGSD